MTYKELRDLLDQLDPDQLNSDVTVFDTAADEYYGLNVELVFTTDAVDVLDPNHPVIRF
jgi:hypothetical protein